MDPGHWVGGLQPESSLGIPCMTIYGKPVDELSVISARKGSSIWYVDIRLWVIVLAIRCIELRGTKGLELAHKV